MTDYSKIDLIWAESGSPPRLVPKLLLPAPPANVPASSADPQSLQPVELGICPLPRCGCGAISFPFHPFCEKVDLAFDLWDMELIKRSEYSAHPDFAQMDQALRSLMTETNLQRLRAWLLTTKLELIEGTLPGEIDIADLPPVVGSRMIGFVDVFPLSLAVWFTHEAAIWSLDDQYCVNLECTCSSTILSFILLKDAQGNLVKNSRQVPAMRYDYISHQMEVLDKGPAGSPPLEDLFASLSRAQPNLDERIKLHHRIMQGLYLRQEIERLRNPVRPRNPVLPFRSQVKIGRNDPCPCGSGKKFKKCCGR